MLEEIARANPTLAVAEARLAEAEALRGAARATRWPELAFEAGYIATDEPARAFGLLLDQRELSLGPGFDPTPGTIDNWRTGVRLDWPLFAPGRSQGVAAAEAGVAAAELAREAAARRVLNAGVQAWLELGATRELAEVARASVAVVEQRLALTQTRAAEGAALRADVLRLEVRLAETRQRAVAAEGEARLAEAALALLIGRPRESGFQLVEEGPVLAAELPATLDALCARALEQRLDLAAAGRELEALGHARESRADARLPSLGFFASYDLDGEDPARDLELGSHALGLGLRWPLTRRTGAAVAQAEAAERAARARLDERRAEVLREVRATHAALAVATETLALAAHATTAAEEAWRLVAAAQDAGAATVTDVLEAEDARRSSAARAVAARAGLERARARLVAALGGVR